MARSNVRLDYDELRKLKEQIEKFGDETEVDKFLKSCSKELAARLLAKVIKRTPVGQYPEGSGKTGGTLRRGWTGGNNSNGASYANSLQVNKVGNDYVIEIINPVEYASYVEFGHRTRNHKGWVEGKFMLTISEDEIRNSAPKILEKKLNNYLKGCFS
jgi:hypothetical protein